MALALPGSNQPISAMRFQRGTLPCTPMVHPYLSGTRDNGSESLSFVYTTMVSTGLAGAHVQPVLEKYLQQLLAREMSH